MLLKPTDSAAGQLSARRPKGLRPEGIEAALASRRERLGRDTEYSIKKPTFSDFSSDERLRVWFVTSAWSLASGFAPSER